MAGFFWHHTGRSADGETGQCSGGKTMEWLLGLKIEKSGIATELLLLMVQKSHPQPPGMYKTL